jgi:hypothetical protein
MLRISENEKKYIRSLYYTKNINEQGSADSPRSFMNPTQYSRYNEKEAKELIDTYNNVITRYDVSTSNGIHNLLSDAQLTAAFATGGVADNYIGLLHSLYWFYEGLNLPENDENRTKKFILGVIELVLAVPGFAELTPVAKWKDTIVNQPVVHSIDKINNIFTPFWRKIEDYFKTINKSLNDMLVFFLEINFDLLANICKFLLDKFDAINSWFFKMVEYMKTLGGGVLKKVESSANVYVTGQNAENLKSGVETILTSPNPKVQTNPNVYSLSNIPMNAQDSTDPAQYQPKQNPTPQKITKKF